MNEQFADLIESSFPNCACEKHSVGTGSPGPVADSETLYRFIISPRDFDPNTNQIHASPFEKVFRNGLSVCRDIASDAEVVALIEDGLLHREGDQPRQIWAVCEARTLEVRNSLDEESERLFGVYDQTVTRADSLAPHVPTHAGVFQRRPLQGTQDRKRIRKDYALKLRELFLNKKTILAEIRGGIFVDINQRAKRGEFSKRK